MKKKIGKYEIISLIGEGGISYVYKGFDPTIRRFVALKILKISDKLLIQRFFREARAEGSIDNENICKIYEFGEDEGIYYIAMQYIDGISFQKAEKELNLEKKILILKKICDGLKEAHKKGIIHRDIKPSNILLEFKEDGDIKPYLIDFGLAREVEKSDFSFPGMILGTLGYMAPEQLKGKQDEIDRRTDIYSLGVVMYEAIAGSLPFEARDLEEMRKAQEKEAVPIRKIKKDVPKDLEAIVMKCLEYEKIKRYDSAKELSEDLESYLNGEPVKAKRTNYFYKFLKKIRKNKIAFYFSIAILILVFSFSIYIINVKKYERRQMEIGMEFNQQAKYVEDMLWYIYSSEIHNIKPQIEVIYERFSQIENAFKSLGKIAFGPGYYALGKSYVAIGDYKKAKENLEIALHKYKFKPNDIYYLLSLSYIMVYFDEKEKALRIEDKILREIKFLKLEKEYLSKADEYLKESSLKDIEAWEFLESLKALSKKDYNLSLKRIKLVKEKFPWLIENRKLEGKIYKNIGDEFLRIGEKEKALENFKMAEFVLNDILDERKSDPEIYNLLSSIYLSEMDLKIYQSSVSPEDCFINIKNNFEKSLKLNVELYEAYNLFSYANLKMGSFYLYEGKNAEKFFKEAILLAKEAIKLNKSDYNCYSNLGSSYLSIGAYKRAIGVDPRAEFCSSIINFKKAIILKPQDMILYNNIALVLWNKGSYEIEIAESPEKSFKEGLAFIEKAALEDPNNSSFFHTMGNLYLELAYFKFSNDLEFSSYLKKAIESFERAVKINPNSALSYNNLAECYLIKLQKKFDGDTFKKASFYIEKALEIKPDFIWSYITYARLEMAEAKNKMEKILDPNESFNNCLRIIKRGEIIEDSNVSLYEVKGELYRMKAEWEIENKKDTENTLKKGIGELDKIIEKKITSANLHSLRGYFYYLLFKGSNNKYFLEKAKEDIKKAISSNPKIEIEFGYILK